MASRRCTTGYVYIAVAKYYNIKATSLTKRETERQGRVHVKKTRIMWNHAGLNRQYIVKSILLLACFKIEFDLKYTNPYVFWRYTHPWFLQTSDHHILSASWDLTSISTPESKNSLYLYDRVRSVRSNQLHPNYFQETSFQLRGSTKEKGKRETRKNRIDRVAGPGWWGW